MKTSVRVANDAPRGIASRLLLVALMTLVSLAMGCAAEGEEGVDKSEDAATVIPRARAAADALEDAKKDADEVAERLAHELAEVRLILTSLELRTYAEAFDRLPDVAKANRTYTEKSVDLAEELERLTSSPKSLARVMDGKVRSYGPKEMYDDYKLLARSAAPTEALALAARIIGRDPALAKLDKSPEDAVRDLMEVALPGAVTQQLVAQGTVEGALKVVQNVLDGCKSSCRDVTDTLSDFARRGNHISLGRSINVAGRNMQSAATAAFAAVAMWNVGSDVASDVRDGRFKEALADIVNGGTKATSALAKTVRTYRILLRGKSDIAWLRGINKFAGRIGAGVEIVSGLIRAFHKLDDWNADTPTKLSLLADLASVGASAAVLLGLGPAGVVLGAIAFALDFLAGWLADRAASAQRKSDEKTCLRARGIDLSLRQIDALLGASKRALPNLRTVVGLSPQRIQELADASPMAFTRQDVIGPRDFSGLVIAKGLFKLSPAEVAGLLDAVGRNTKGEQLELVLFFFRLALDNDLGWNADLSHDQALDRLAYEESLLPAVAKPAMVRARAYLAAR